MNYSVQQLVNDLYEHRRIVILFVISVTVITVSTVYFVWSTLMHQQLQFLQNSTFFTDWYHTVFTSTTSNVLPPVKDPFRMIRCRTTTTTTSVVEDAPSSSSNTKAVPKIQMLTLNPEFVTYCQNLNRPSTDPSVPTTSVSSTPSSPSPQSPPQPPHQHWNVMSLGEYISSLRPYFAATASTSNEPNTTSDSSSNSMPSMLPNWLEGEVQAALAVALFSTLGPQWGTAILPTLGLNLMQTTVRKIVSIVSSYIPSFETENQNNNNKSVKDNHDVDGMLLHDDLHDLCNDDLGTVPLSISTMSTGAEINYQQYQRQRHNQNQTNNNNNKSFVPQKKLTPLDLLRMGEVGYPITFGSNDSQDVDDSIHKSSNNNNNASINSESKTTTTTPCNTQDGLPNPFILSEHWYTTIAEMEERMKQSSGTGIDTANTTTPSTYDPWSCRMQPPPKLIDERFFPDLYLGYGDDVSCTHNQRQILYNRLISTLLNRLAYNRHIEMTTTTAVTNANVSSVVSPKYFTVQISTEQNNDIQQPCDLIQALIESGHTVVTSIQTQPTTFGMALCVKEEAVGSETTQWTNIPFGYFLQTGLSDRHGKEAYVCLPHSGLSLKISNGPILRHHRNNSATINVQHYMAIEGLCGWHSNHCANVPWIRSITCPDTIRQNHDTLESIRIATWQAIVTNTVGTKYDLPYGGYGLTGVCNDSAAQIECAISPNGTTTHIYPLSFQGKFAMYTLRMANEIRRTLLKRHGGSDSSASNKIDQFGIDDIQSIDHLIRAIISLPSDTNTAPISDMIHQCQRYLYCCNSGGGGAGSSNLSSTTSNHNDMKDTAVTTSSTSTTTTTTTTTTVPPPLAFQLLVESRTIVEAIQDELLTIRQNI